MTGATTNLNLTLLHPARRALPHLHPARVLRRQDGVEPQRRAALRLSRPAARPPAAVASAPAPHSHRSATAQRPPSRACHTLVVAAEDDEEVGDAQTNRGRRRGGRDPRGGDRRRVPARRVRRSSGSTRAPRRPRPPAPPGQAARHERAVRPGARPAGGGRDHHQRPGERRDRRAGLLEPAPGGQASGRPAQPGRDAAQRQMPSAGATPPSGGQQGSMPDPSQMFGTALDDLVSDGTITSAQETAISEALSSAMQQGGPGRQQTSTSSTRAPRRRPAADARARTRAGR